MIRCAPFCPMPGTAVRVRTSSPATARRTASGVSTASIACASFGPTPLAVCTSSKTCFSSSSANPKRVRESSRTTIDVGRVAVCPVRSAARVLGVHISSRPTPPTSSTALVRVTAATSPRTNAITDGSSLVEPVETAASAASMRACAPPAPDVGDRQRERVGGVGRLRRRVEPQDAGHHRADLGLVGAAAAGHRGLDLGRRVQRDRQAASRGRDHRDPAGLGGAHHGAGVGPGEDPLDRDRVGPVLVEPGLDAPLDVDQPQRDVLVGRGAQDVDVDQAQRPADARPRPRPCRTGSARGRSPARACRPPRRCRPRPNTCSHVTLSARPAYDTTCRVPTTSQRSQRRSESSRQHLVGDVDVGEDVLDVVEVLERVDEPEHLARGVGVDRDVHASRTNCTSAES